MNLNNHIDHGIVLDFFISQRFKTIFPLPLPQRKEKKYVMLNNNFYKNALFFYIFPINVTFSVGYREVIHRSIKQKLISSMKDDNALKA